jgi:YggT family protein
LLPPAGSVAPANAGKRFAIICHGTCACRLRAGPTADIRQHQGENVELVLSILNMFLTVMLFAIIIRAVLSWFDPRGSNPVSRALIEFTEPIIAPIRSIMPRMGMIDLSPMIAVFIIIMLQRMIQTAANT